MDLGTYICLGFIVMMLVALIIVKISQYEIEKEKIYE